MISLLFLYAIFQFATAFPENLTPITILQDVPQRVFFSDDVISPLFVQSLKKLDLGGSRHIAIAGREKMFLMDARKISPFAQNDSMNFTEVLTWKSNKETRDLCRIKGQPQEYCYNYLSILETKADDVLILCGTNSYSPQCANFKVSARKHEIKLTQDGAMLPGRQISPFGPSQSGASFYTGTSLYSATYQSFLGGTPVVTRTMGDTPSLRTDATSTLMREPKFVKITEDNERVLIFFNEKDYLPTGETRTIAQVAQICKNDQGGDRVLQRMFTTFLKSRLNCSYNGFYLDQVRDVTDPVQIGDQSMIFATFATPDNSLSGSAVCSFNLSAIHSAMSGPFLISDDVTSTSAPPTGSRHPGKCPENKATDSELVFVKSHPQMEKHVIGSLLLTNQGKRWTAITVDVISDLNNLPVVFIGTEDGQLVRALPPSKEHPRGKILSEQNVFDASRCSAPLTTEKQLRRPIRQVERILIEEDAVLVGFKHCVISLPLRWCSSRLCRTSCLRSSDPYCGWNGTACVPVITPDPSLEQDLYSDSSALVAPCLTGSKEDQNPEKPEENLDVTLPYPPDEDAQRNEEESHLQQQDSYSFDSMIIVGAVASAITIFLVVFLYCFCYNCYCKKRKNKDPEDFNEKQLQQQHSLAMDEKNNSLSRRAHKTFCGMRNWFWKATPIHSPELPLKRDSTKRHERRQNEYTPAPTPNLKNGEKPRLSRIMSNRLNSTSSATSREDSMGFIATQPLLQRQSNVSGVDTELTLPKNFADQPTLPHTSKPSGDSTTSSGVSSHSSGSSPVFHDHGAAETGIFPTASAKLRRRNENVARQTSEIMRVSDTAMGNFEDAIYNIKVMKVQDSMSDNERMASPARYRIDSHDSGRGDSCRNSIRAECEHQAFPNGNPKLQRPASLDINGHPPHRRRRLHSEGSHPHDPLVGAPIMISQAPPGRERRISGTLSNHSQASTPISEHPNGYIFHPPPPQQAMVNVSTYSTLPKEDCFRKPQPRDLLRLKSLQHELMPRQPIEGYSNQPPPYHQEPVYIPAMTTQYVCTNAPINYYPSLQVRGAHAQPVTMHQQKPQQNRRSYSPPHNYYPSLPTHVKGSQFSNRYSHPPNYSSLERKTTTPGKKRQSVPLTRHTSMPASERPVCITKPIKTQGISG